MMDQRDGQTSAVHTKQALVTTVCSPIWIKRTPEYQNSSRNFNAVRDSVTSDVSGTRDPKAAVSGEKSGKVAE